MMKVMLFVSSGCPHCPMAEAVVKKVIPKYKGMVDFEKVRSKTEKGRELLSRLNVMSFPTIIFFKDGEELGRIVGVPSEGSMKKKIEKYMGLRKSFFSRLFKR
jgi:thioredoxin 1